jgi:hypothetical protein
VAPVLQLRTFVRDALRCPAICTAPGAGEPIRADCGRSATRVEGAGVTPLVHTPPALDDVSGRGPLRHQPRQSMSGPTETMAEAEETTWRTWNWSRRNC